jgi:hypothetical protein
MSNTSTALAFVCAVANMCHRCNAWRAPLVNVMSAPRARHERMFVVPTCECCPFCRGIVALGSDIVTHQGLRDDVLQLPSTNWRLPCGHAAPMLQTLDESNPSSSLLSRQSAAFAETIFSIQSCHQNARTAMVLMRTIVSACTRVWN